MANLKDTMDALKATDAAQVSKSDEPWWKQVPPEKRDWWTRRLNAMPHADGKFRDDMFKKPIAAGTETLDFDKNVLDPDWLAGDPRSALDAISRRRVK